MKRGFWNQCPRRLSAYPDKPCTLGKTSVEAKDSDKSCEWYINSEVDRYCFWTWMRRVSDSNGVMEPLTQQEIGALLGYSSSKIHTTYKEGMEKLRALPDFAALEALFKD